jgi:hypothetical protein
MRSIYFGRFERNFEDVLDAVAAHGGTTARNYRSMCETLHLFGTVANAVRLQDAMLEAEAVLPPGARVLKGPRQASKLRE